MSEYESDVVRKVLRSLGLERGRGHADGHENWLLGARGACRPVLRHGAIVRRQVDILAAQLGRIGAIDSKNDLFRLLDGAARRGRKPNGRRGGR